jgi:putative PIN family toxin of toxin-antitoxin system
LGYLVIDTSVFIHLKGKMSNVLHCIETNHDVIAVSKGAISEYEPLFLPNALLLQSFLNELESKRKLKLFGKNHIDASVRRLLNAHRTLHYPEHQKDKKWVDLAIASHANYILSKDRHILVLPPNPCNNHSVEPIDPSHYITNQPLNPP